VSTYIANALPALAPVAMKNSREKVEAAKQSLAPGATPTAVTLARLSTGAFVATHVPLRGKIKFAL
jgi:hypothetical protein